MKPFPLHRHFENIFLNYLETDLPLFLFLVDDINCCIILFVAPFCCIEDPLSCIILLIIFLNILHLLSRLIVAPHRRVASTRASARRRTTALSGPQARRMAPDPALSTASWRRT